MGLYGVGGSGSSTCVPGTVPVQVALEGRPHPSYNRLRPSSPARRSIDSSSSSPHLANGALSSSPLPGQRVAGSCLPGRTYSRVTDGTLPSTLSMHEGVNANYPHRLHIDGKGR